MPCRNKIVIDLLNLECLNTQQALLQLVDPCQTLDLMILVEPLV